MLKETVKYLDKPFVFQLRNLSPRETRVLPQVTWPGWRVTCRLPPFPAWVQYAITPKLTSSFGKYRVYADLCVYFSACQHKMIYVYTTKEGRHAFDFRSVNSVCHSISYSDFPLHGHPFSLGKDQDAFFRLSVGAKKSH